MLLLASAGQRRLTPYAMTRSWMLTARNISAPIPAKAWFVQRLARSDNTPSSQRLAFEGFAMYVNGALAYTIQVARCLKLVTERHSAKESAPAPSSKSRREMYVCWRPSVKVLSSLRLKMQRWHSTFFVYMGGCGCLKRISEK